VLIVIFPEIPEPPAGPDLLRQSRPAAVRHERFRQPGQQIGSPVSARHWHFSLTPKGLGSCAVSGPSATRKVARTLESCNLPSPRAALERLLDERGLSRAGPRSAPTLAGMAEVHRKRWFSAGGFALAMK
jgi:hypothetical protein